MIMISGFLRPVGTLSYGNEDDQIILKNQIKNRTRFIKNKVLNIQKLQNLKGLQLWEGRGSTQLKSQFGWVQIGVNDRFQWKRKTTWWNLKKIFEILQHVGWSWNLSKSCYILQNHRSWILESLKSWIILEHLGILIFLGRSSLGIFEILNNYGTPWKINILESSSS